MTHHNNKPVIVQVNSYPPPYGGVSIHIQRLRNFLDSQNIKCFVIDHFGEEKDRDFDRLYPFVYSLKGAKFKKFFKMLYILKKIDPHIAHFHIAAFNYFYPTFFLLCGLRLRNKVVTIHGGSAIQKLKQNKAFSKRFINMFDHIIAVNYHLSDFLLTELRVNSKKISVIPAFMSPINNQQSVEKSFRILLNEFKKKVTKVIVSSGYLRKHYGFHIILKALESLKIKDLGIVLVFYTETDQEYLKKIYSLAENFANVRIFWNLKPGNFFEVLKIGDIYVRATEWDGDPVALREAIYFGQRVIATDCVARPKGCLLFRTNDFRDLRVKLQAALRDRNLGIVKKENIGQDNGDKILEIYENLLS